MGARQVPPARPLQALARCRAAFSGVALLSAAVNILMLTGSVFMLEVYDRVLPSRSVPTLIGLVVVAGMLYLFLGLFDLIRNRILARVGDAFDAAMSGRIYDLVLARPLQRGAAMDALQPLRDVDQVRSYLAGSGPAALFDLPWLPFYLFLCFAFHFWIGVTAAAGAVLLIVLTIATEFGTRRHVSAAVGHATMRHALAEGGRRNAEVVRAMGMAQRLTARWGDANRRYLESQRRAADVASGLGAGSRIVRMMLQSGVLAVGAYLVIHQQASAGLIIASSILVARAVAPVELVIANWKGFVGARQSLGRLQALCDLHPAEPRPDAPTRARLLPQHLGPVRRAAGHPARGGAGRRTAGRRRQCPRDHRAQCLRQVLARPRPGRRVAAGSRQDPSRRRRPRRTGRPRGSGAMSATCRRTSSCSPARWPRTSPASSLGHARRIIAAARAADVHEMIVALPEGYDTADRRGRHDPLRRSAAAHRTCASAVRRSVPGRAR